MPDRPEQHDFPLEAVRTKLRDVLERMRDDGAIPGDPLQPELDSLEVVEVLIEMEDLFEAAPEKVVKRGGYQSIEEAVDHMTEQYRSLWIEQFGEQNGA